MNSKNLVKKLLVLTASIALLSPYAVFAQNKTLSWTGCGITKKAFMQEIAAQYEKKTGVAISLSGGGATKGIRATSAGSVDLGGTCRHLLMEGNKLHPEENNVQLIQVAWDAIVVITNKNNPVDNISTENLKKVYDGDITTWKDLGSDDKRIVLCTREGAISGVGHMFRLLVTNSPGEEFKAKSLTFKSSGPLEKKVKATPTALGITGVSSARKAGVKILALDGVEPTKENIAAGKYPLFRPLYLAVHRNPSPDVQAFVKYILSDEGQQVISNEGTVNLQEGKGLVARWSQRSQSQSYHTE